jgi:anti-sigma B factor antagonist
MIETPDRATDSTPTDEPADPSFRCDVLYVEEHAVVSPHGDIDLSTAPAVQRAAFGTLALPIEQVTMDFAGVTFMDSSGLNMLVHVQRRAAELGIGFSLVHPGAGVRRVLQVTRLADLLGVSLDLTEESCS